MVAHSPGPWHRQQPNNRPVQIVSHGAWEHVATIVDFAPDRDQRTAEANARLIQAAPSLLAALIRYWERDQAAMPVHPFNGTQKPCNCGCCHEAQEAIAIATTNRF